MTGDNAAPAGRVGTRRRTWRRVLVVTPVIGVVLLAVVLGGGGWYFAGQIRADGLAVRHDRPEYNVTVVSYDGHMAKLREARGQTRNDTLRSGYVYGLGWPGGSGVLGSIQPGGSDGAVVRPLTVTTGTRPAPDAPAELRRDVYGDPGSAYGVRFREVAYGCAGGSCPAWYVPGRSSTWAVLVHGWRAGRSEPLRALGPVLDAGLPALVIGYRNDEGAPGDPSGFYRFGATEWRDLDSAVGYARAHGARHVVLVGVSMGGGIAAAFLERSAHAEAVTGLVLDAPLLDFQRTVDHGAAQRELPVVGGPIPGPLTWTAKTIAGWRYGIDWERIDYLDRDWLRVPALVFHGTADPLVPVATSDAFRASHPHLVEEVRVEGAAHVESWNAGPARYRSHVSAFLTRVGS
jgi:pimeloyl-ACP methyl ester carboxylesterase